MEDRIISTVICDFDGHNYHFYHLDGALDDRLAGSEEFTEPPINSWCSNACQKAPSYDTCMKDCCEAMCGHPCSQTDSLL